MGLDPVSGDSPFGFLIAVDACIGLPGIANSRISQSDCVTAAPLGLRPTLV